MINKIYPYLTTAKGRLVTGLALVTAIVVGLWPDHSRSFDPVRAGAIATAAVAWLYAELAGAGTASDHDVKLFNAFRQAVSVEEKNFLLEQDFHFSFVYKYSEGLREIAHWNGAAYEFVDERLQGKWEPLINQVNNFVLLMAQYSAPVQSSANLMTVHPSGGDSDHPEPWVLKEIGKLNASASNLYKNLDEFERFARKRMRL